MKKMFLIVLLTQLAAVAGPFQVSAQTPPLLAKAQQAYLHGEFSMAVNTLKQAFMAAPNDTIVQKNILQLYRQIRVAQPKAQIDVGWTLPKEIQEMRIHVTRRSDNGLIRNQLVISGEEESVNDLTAFQIIRYPDTIVMDKQRKIGNFQDEVENNQAEFDYRSQSTPFAITSGLYLLRISTKNGRQVDGWFFLDDDANSTAQPQITNFDGAPVFNTATPMIRWNDFVSPQFKKGTERRSMGIWVTKTTVDASVWSFWTTDMTQNSAVIGSPIPTDNGWGTGPLTNGDYYLVFHYMESHPFGPIRISRRSSVVKYFTIKLD